MRSRWLRKRARSSFYLICRKDEEPAWELTRATGLAGLGSDRDGLKHRHDETRGAIHRDEIVCFTDSSCRKRVWSFEMRVNAVRGESLRLSNGRKFNDGKQNAEIASARIDAAVSCNGDQCAYARFQDANGATGKGFGLAVLSIRNIGLAVTFQQVVHSSKTREADCDEQSTQPGAPEWTFIRMHDLPSSVESS